MAVCTDTGLSLAIIEPKSEARRARMSSQILKQHPGLSRNGAARERQGSGSALRRRAGHGVVAELTTWQSDVMALVILGSTGASGTQAMFFIVQVAPSAAGGCGATISCPDTLDLPRDPRANLPHTA